MEETKSVDVVPVTVAMCLLVIIVFFLGMEIGGSITDRRIRQLAIAHGAAQWVDIEEGRVFKWIDRK